MSSLFAYILVFTMLGGSILGFLYELLIIAKWHAAILINGGRVVEFERSVYFMAGCITIVQVSTFILVVKAVFGA